METKGNSKLIRLNVEFQKQKGTYLINILLIIQTHNHT